MPMCQPKLNITDFRSLAPAAGVYAAPPRPRPAPRPGPGACAPPAGPGPCAGAGAWAPAAGAAPRACALDSDGMLMMRVAPMATLVHLNLFREAIMISRYRFRPGYRRRR